MKSKYTIALLAFVFILFPVVLSAQRETGSIQGVVTDPSGAVVPGAGITVTSVEKQNTRTAVAGSKGEYIVTNLEPGTYDVTVVGPGFSPVKRRVQITVGGRQTVDARLAVAGAGTTVEVQAQGGAQVNTQDQTVSQVVTGVQVRELPTITRDPYDLVALSGNVTTSEVGENANITRGVGGNSINGQRPTSTSILLDGVENVNLFDTTVGTTVPLDSVQEFQVITSSFTAEYGRASGGVVNVATRSGSNDFHGSLYEFNRVSRFSANTYQNLATGQPRNHFVRNQFGYAVGGPVVKNKLFFFQSTEWRRVRSTLNSQAFIPTPQFLASAASNTQTFFNQLGHLRPQDHISRVVTLAQAQAGPAPLISTPGPLLGALPPTTPIFDLVNFPTAQDAGGGDPQNSYFGVIRVDYNISDKTQFYGRYAGDHEIFFPGFVSTSPYNGFETTQKTFNQNASLNLTHLFTASTVSSTKLDYNRFNLFQPLGTAGVVPGIAPRATVPVTLNGINLLFPGYLPLAPSSAIPFGGPQNLYQVLQDVSVTRGPHTFKFGGGYIQTRDNRTFGAFETGFYALSPTGSAASSLDALLAGNVFQFQGAVNPQGKFPCVVNPVTNKPVVTAGCTVALPVVPPSFVRNNAYNDSNAYVQDSYKATKRLTVNLGLRWDYFGVQHNAPNRSLDSNFYFGTGANFFQQVTNGFVATTPNSPHGTLWSPKWQNFQPRAGFALDVFGDGRTSIRGGYGIGYERNFGNVTFNVIQNPPAYAVISLRSPGDISTPIPVSTSNFGPLGAPSGSAPLLRTSLRAVNPNINTAYSHFYSLTFEHEMARNTVFNVGYSGSRGIHQYSISDISPLGSGVVFGGLNPNVVVTTARLNQQYSNINFRSSNGDSYYNALNVGVNSRNFHNTGLSLTANYTWAHSIDDLSSTFSEQSNNFNLGFLEPFNPGFDRGNSDFDVRHRVVISAIYEVPFKGSGFDQLAFGGWEFAPIFNAQTGTPFSVFDATNSVELTPRYTPLTSFPSILGNTSPKAIGPNSFSYLVLPPRVDVNNPVLGFSDLGPFPANMTTRNEFRGPNHWWLDFGVYKNFKVTERVTLQLRGEAYNIFNHPNLWVVGSSADPSSSFVDVGQAGCPAVPGATAGVNVCPLVQAKKGGIPGVLSPATNTHEQRNMQFALKVNF